VEGGEVAETVDRRVVANPEQVRSLLMAVRQQGLMGEHLVPFFGCLYFAGMRPGEAIALRGNNCMLPRRGWGRLNLAESEPRAGGIGRMTGVRGNPGIEAPRAAGDTSGADPAAAGAAAAGAHP
jgi:hypothetical protein